MMGWCFLQPGVITKMQNSFLKHKTQDLLKNLNILNWVSNNFNCRDFKQMFLPLSSAYHTLSPHFPTIVSNSQREGSRKYGRAKGG